MSTPAAQILKSVSRASAQSSESSCRMTSMYRSDGTTSIQSACTSFGTRSPSRRRSSIATQPECEAAQGTNVSTPLASTTASASSTSSSTPKSPDAGSDRPWPRQSKLSTRLRPPAMLGDLLPALPARAPAGEEEERRLAAAPVVVVDPNAVCLAPPCTLISSLRDRHAAARVPRGGVSGRRSIAAPAHPSASATALATAAGALAMPPSPAPLHAERVVVTALSMTTVRRGQLGEVGIR